MTAGFFVADPVDVTGLSWTAEACSKLRRHGYARLRLSAPEVTSLRDLYLATHEFFEDKAAMRELEIPDNAVDRLDERSGYVYGRNRELFELHPECPSAAELNQAQNPAARRFLNLTWAVTGICQRRCDEVLEQIAVCTESGALREMLASGNHASPSPSKVTENMLRIYRYSKKYDRTNGDVDTHFDMGTLSIVPKSTTPGLYVQPTSVEEAPFQAAGRLPASHCHLIEEKMGDDEVLMFVGMTLARLTGIPALKHGVFTDGKVRYSAPFFQRFSPWCMLPALEDHPRETVKCYNQRLRDAENEELRGNGAVILDRRRDDSRERDSQPQKGSDEQDRKGITDLQESFPVGLKGIAGYGSDGGQRDSWGPRSRSRSRARCCHLSWDMPGAGPVTA